MSTRIVFDNGLNLTVLQDEAVVADALARQLTLEGRSGRPLHVNWDRVAFIGARPRRRSVHRRSSSELHATNANASGAGRSGQPPALLGGR